VKKSLAHHSCPNWNLTQRRRGRREDIFSLAGEGRQGKKGLRRNKSGKFEGLGFLLFGLSPESKKDTLCVLRDFAVNLGSKWHKPTGETL